MIRHYCTLFDKNYLYQGVALYRSLTRVAGDFRLYALCMDSAAYDLLAKMRADKLIPIRIEDLLTPEISAVRSRTTHGQFCWVCQPLICQFVLDRFGVDLVTYLESDSLFFSSPESLFEEMGPRSATLVPHNYSSGFDNTDVAGRFCVQFNAFRNDDTARAVLDYWRSCCFEYDKSEPLQYPGQTSLDEWPTKFNGVAIIGNRGAGVAPWNVLGYRLETHEGLPYVDSQPTVFFHYHQYGRFRSGAHELGSYPFTSAVIDMFYRPYVVAMREAERVVQSVDSAFKFRRQYELRGTLLEVLSLCSKEAVVAYLNALKRKARGRYHVYPDAYFPDDGAGSATS